MQMLKCTLSSPAQHLDPALVRVRAAQATGELTNLQRDGIYVCSRLPLQPRCNEAVHKRTVGAGHIYVVAAGRLRGKRWHG